MASDVDIAQARVLVSALEEQIVAMSSRQAELREEIGRRSRYQTPKLGVLRRAEAQLSDDIAKARSLIDRLRRSYLVHETRPGDETSRQELRAVALPGRGPAFVVGVQK